MDYIFLSSMKGEDVVEIKLSYDIACRWWINLYSRIREHYPAELQVNGSRVTIVFFVPKFHLPAHGSSCHTKFSFNFGTGVGRTHGETVEQEWSHINGAALATREMGPGARHAALDDNWGGWNWRKVLGLRE